MKCSHPINDYDGILSIEGDLVKQFPDAVGVKVLFWRLYEESKDAKGL